MEPVPGHSLLAPAEGAPKTLFHPGYRQPRLAQPNHPPLQFSPTGGPCAQPLPGARDAPTTCPRPHSPTLATERHEPPAQGLQGRDRLRSEHLTGESGPSLHSYLHPGVADPGNEATCVRQQVEASPGAVPTSQTCFKARASSTERHRDLFLLDSLTLLSAWSLLPAGLGAALAAQQRGEGSHFPLCLSLPLPGDVPWLPGTAAAWQDGAGSALPTHSAGASLPSASLSRGLQGSIRTGTFLPRPTSSLHPGPAGKDTDSEASLESVWVPSIRPARVLPLGRGCTGSRELFLL